MDSWDANKLELFLADNRNLENVWTNLVDLSEKSKSTTSCFRSVAFLLDLRRNQALQNVNPAKRRRPLNCETAKENSSGSTENETCPENRLSRDKKKTPEFKAAVNHSIHIAATPISEQSTNTDEKNILEEKLSHASSTQEGRIDRSKWRLVALCNYIYWAVDAVFPKSVQKNYLDIFNTLEFGVVSVDRQDLLVRVFLSCILKLSEPVLSEKILDEWIDLNNFGANVKPLPRVAGLDSRSMDSGYKAINLANEILSMSNPASQVRKLLANILCWYQTFVNLQRVRMETLLKSATNEPGEETAESFAEVTRILFNTDTKDVALLRRYFACLIESSVFLDNEIVASLGEFDLVQGLIWTSYKITSFDDTYRLKCREYVDRAFEKIIRTQLEKCKEAKRVQEEFENRTKEVQAELNRRLVTIQNAVGYILTTSGNFKAMRQPYNPFIILGLSNRCSEPDIQKVWRKLILLIHPDKIMAIPGCPPGVVRRSNEAFVLLSQAQQAALNALRDGSNVFMTSAVCRAPWDDSSAARPQEHRPPGGNPRMGNPSIDRKPPEEKPCGRFFATQDATKTTSVDEESPNISKSPTKDSPSADDSPNVTKSPKSSRPLVVPSDYLCGKKASEYSVVVDEGSGYPDFKINSIDFDGLSCIFSLGTINPEIMPDTKSSAFIIYICHPLPTPESVAQPECSIALVTKFASLGTHPDYKIDGIPISPVGPDNKIHYTIGFRSLHLRVKSRIIWHTVSYDINVRELLNSPVSIMRLSLRSLETSSRKIYNLSLPESSFTDKMLKNSRKTALVDLLFAVLNSKTFSKI